MRNTPEAFELDMAGLAKAAWLERLAAVAQEHGYFQSLGEFHVAAFVQDAPILLVTFESLQGIQALSESGQPLGWEMVKNLSWSHLALISDGDTWFRDPAVFSYFDGLIDDGFFDNFDQVLFYGAGPCGYAAAAFSVASPGARVVMVQPQATLDPAVSEWDDRFAEMRRLSFTDRFGYAPDMLDAADQCHVFYDSSEKLDAMHTALFTRPNLRKFRLRRMGSALQHDLLQMGLLLPILAKALNGTLTASVFAPLYRARRDHGPYLRRLVAALDSAGRPALALLACRSVVKRLKVPRLEMRLKELEKAANAGEFTPISRR